MTEQEIEQHIERIATLSGGLPEQAREQIRRLLNVRYLDGVHEGLKQAMTILKA